MRRQQIDESAYSENPEDSIYQSIDFDKVVSVVDKLISPWFNHFHRPQNPTRYPADIRHLGVRVFGHKAMKNTK